MANDDANMSEGEICSPERARNRLRGGERERRRRARPRSRSRGRRGCSRSSERRDSSHWSPRRRSPDRRRWSQERSHRSSRDDKWRPRDGSPTSRDMQLATERTTSFEHCVISTNQSNPNSEVVLVSSAPKPKAKQQCMRGTFDEYEYVSHQNKRQKLLETPKVDILKQQPVLSLDDQSTEGFMDLEEGLLSSFFKPSTVKPRKSVPSATQETSLDMAMDQGIHPDRMRRLSDDADMDAEDIDIITSDSFEALKDHRPAPESFNTNLIPVGGRSWKAKSAGPPTPSIPASLASDNDGWGVDGRGASANSAPVSQSQVTASHSSAQYDDIFEEPLDGVSTLPPPLFAAPSHNSLSSSPAPRPVTPVLPAGPPRTRQQLYDDYLLECDKIEKEDVERWERQGTIKYQVFDDEVEVILARMSVNAEHDAYATEEFWYRPGQSFLKHKEDRRFISDPGSPRLDEKGWPLAQYEEGKTTSDRLLEAQGRAMALIRKTKPEPNEPPIVFRYPKEEMAREAWRIQYEEENRAKLNFKNGVNKCNAQEQAVAASSAQKSETAATALLSKPIDENILAVM